MSWYYNPLLKSISCACDSASEFIWDGPHSWDFRSEEMETQAYSKELKAWLII